MKSHTYPNFSGWRKWEKEQVTEWSTPRLNLRNPQRIIKAQNMPHFDEKYILWYFIWSLLRWAEAGRMVRRNYRGIPLSVTPKPFLPLHSDTVHSPLRSQLCNSRCMIQPNASLIEELPGLCKLIWKIIKSALKEGAENSQAQLQQNASPFHSALQMYCLKCLVINIGIKHRSELSQETQVKRKIHIYQHHALWPFKALLVDLSLMDNIPTRLVVSLNIHKATGEGTNGKTVPLETCL